MREVVTSLMVFAEDCADIDASKAERILEDILHLS